MDWLSLADVEARVNALESLMVEKGLAEHEAVDAVVASFENDMGPMNGAKVVARAWTDPEYKQWLLTDATAAIADMGFTGLQTEHLVAMENTDERHNVVVCTLCSCYPWTLLGIPPAWFKYPQYRARVVKEPRSVLAEFGLILPDTVKIDVWDSSAEIRYLVIPQRPEGTDGMTADELVPLISRDSMVGTALASSPQMTTPQVGLGRYDNPGGLGALPRSNGELAFDAPWQGRLFGLVVHLCNSGCFEWDEFKRHLIAVIEDSDVRDTRDPSVYYRQFGEAFCRLAAEKNFFDESTLEQRTRIEAQRLTHDHNHPR